MEEKKAKKIAFFTDLYELDESDDESDDTSEIGRILRQSKILVPPRSLPKLTPHLRSCHPLGRTTSAPLPNSSNAPNKVHISQGGPCPDPVPIVNPAFQNHITVDRHKMSNGKVATTSTKPLSKAKGKRKRGQSLELIPDSQQVFKGLSFCMAFTLVRLLRKILRDEM